jgi:glycosyltransferase involved in cell wall biosynthesis
MPFLLSSLVLQEVDCPIIVADADSTDRTVSIVDSFRDRLDITIIQGGPVSYGRNAGARLAKTEYLCFIDADVVLQKPDLLYRCELEMMMHDYDMITTNIHATRGSRLGAKLIYCVHNVFQLLSKYTTPFSTGAFMFVSKDAFDKLGGFDEKILFSEDYYLSKQIERKKFKVILDSHVLTTDRRFGKVSYWWMIKSCFLSFVNRNNYDYFLRDVNYWD